MDVEISSFTILISFFIFLIVLLRLTALSKTKRKSTLNLPPGPRKLPFIGNMHLLANSRPIHHTLRDLAMKYGSLMQLQLGEVTTIVVSSPETAKEVLKTHDITFADRPPFLATQILFYQYTDIASAQYSEYWRELRKICTLELLSAKRTKSFRPVREEEFENLCRWIASNAGSPVDLTEKIFSTICGVVSQASFGKKTELQDAFIPMIEEMSEVTAGFHIGDFYPSIKFLSLIDGMKGRLERLHQKLDVVLQKIIDEHKIANTLSTVSKTKHEDLVDILLKFHDDGHELPLTMDNIKAVLLDMFAAGTDTSATTTVWAMSEMLRHPRILKKAQDEVRQVFENKGCVDESYFHELKYLKLVIKETLRMHPPLPLLLPRESSEQCEINGHGIPAKSRILINAWAIGRDPRHWKEPTSFKPERHLDNSVDYKGNDFELIPFGAGRRMCPGMSFGLANVELPLAMFLYHFDWSLPHGMKPDELDMTETVGLAASRKSPLYVIPNVKKPLPV